MTQTDRQSVLIVDDEPANIQLIAEILRGECDLYFATSGEEALRVAQLALPDLILLDVLMPGMDGFEACQRLKGNPATRDIPVIFVTTRGEVDDETRGLEVGGLDYIIKPISLPIVRARVRVHLRLKRREDQLRASALVDGLTGIANRRRLDEVLNIEWRRARRAQEAISVILVDVDYFKLYNDHYGHLEGDSCLQRVARVLSGFARRPGDLVARYGGEEFVCVLPATDLGDAMALAEQMRIAVLNERMEHASSPVSPLVTMSAGVAATVPDEDQDPMVLLKLADDMLYRSKRSGRNRIEGGMVEGAQALEARVTPVGS